MRKSVVSVLLIASSVLLVLLLLFGDKIMKFFTEPHPDREIIYWAHGNIDPNDSIPQKDAEKYFGFNRYRAAQEAIKAGDAKTVEEFLVKDGDGDLFSSMYHDPALTAAIALHLDRLGLTGDTPILAPEKDLPIGQQADAAHLRFLKDEQAWDDALARSKGILLGKDVTYEVKRLSNYQSAMYMEPQAIDGDKPAVIVRNTNNAGGHFLVFHVKTASGKIIDVKLRLECGYQPIDTPGWTPPPGDDPEPKNPEDDPQNNPDALKNDFYSPSRVNHDPDKTATDEPVSPDEDYVAPEVHTVIVTQAPTPPDNHGDGTVETVDGTPYTVETGDTEELPPLEEIAEEGNPEKPPVDPALAGDSIITGSPTSFE